MGRRTIILITVVIVTISAGFLVYRNLGSITNIDFKGKIFGGQIDQYGCLGSAGYAYSEDIKACIRKWELNRQSKQQAARLAVAEIGPDNGWTVTGVSGFICTGCFTVNLQNRNTVKTVTIEDWKIKKIEEGEIIRFQGFIKRAENNVIKIDEIEFLAGDEAIEQAVNDTGCPKERITECAASLNNNFYISNKEKNESSFNVSSEAEIYIMPNPGSPVLLKVDYPTFEEEYKKAENMMSYLPFNLERRNNVLTFIEEQYTP